MIRLILAALLLCGTAQAQTPTVPTITLGRSVFPSDFAPMSAGKCDVNASACTVTPSGSTAIRLGDIFKGLAVPPRMAIGDPAVPDWTTFGTAGANVGLLVGMQGGNNAIVGTTYNNTPAGTAAFPTGVTGHGRLNSGGGTVFGLFGRADLYSSGTATNEVNSFNYCGSTSALLPPNRSFGTTECNAIPLQIVPYGNANSNIGLLFTSGVNDAGNAPILMRTALYMSPDSFYGSGINIDASAADTYPAIIINRGGAGQHITLKSTGTASPNSPVISYTTAAGAVTFAVAQSGDVAASTTTLTPVTYANLPTPTAGRVAYCSDCFAAPSTTVRGTLVFGNGSAWQAMQSSAATH